MKINLKRFVYLLLSLTFLLIEIQIGLFVHDSFVRPYVGDVLVIILLCCLARIVLPEKPIYLGLYMIAVGIVAELLQLLHLDVYLHVEETVLGIILGSTFDIWDIVCYSIGGILFWGAERIIIDFCHFKHNDHL